jgi:phosphatidylglycerol:prolipoprotein diacylglycerol transferase
VLNPVLLHFGPFALHWYGVFIVGGAVAAAWLSARNATKAGENPDHIWSLLAWTMIIGIIGARLYHVLSSPADGIGWSYYRQHPLEAIDFWNGGFRGLGIYGGVVGGVLAVIVYAWYHKLDAIRYLDFIAPNVLIAQALGRMGNFANQELYGQPTNLPWAFHINPRYPCMLPTNLPAGIQPCGTSEPLTAQTLQWYATHGFHPTFFYEASWNVVMFALLSLLIWRFGHRLRMGDAIFLYLIAYPLGRFWVEMFRPDAWTIGALATAQWIALLLVIIGIAGLLVRHSGWQARQHPEETLMYSSSKT